MKYQTIEEYEAYHKQLKQQGYSVETTLVIPTEETYKKLEERIGKMPWNLIKPAMPEEIKETYGRFE